MWLCGELSGEVGFIVVVSEDGKQGGQSRRHIRRDTIPGTYHFPGGVPNAVALRQYLEYA